jgi:hypothetical protein
VLSACLAEAPAVASEFSFCGGIRPLLTLASGKKRRKTRTPISEYFGDLSSSPLFVFCKLQRF